MKIIDIWKFVIGVSWAKSFLWVASDTDYMRTYLLSIHLTSKGDMVGLCLVFFPISIIIGFNK